MYCLLMWPSDHTVQRRGFFIINTTELSNLYLTQLSLLDVCILRASLGEAHVRFSSQQLDKFSLGQCLLAESVNTVFRVWNLGDSIITMRRFTDWHVRHVAVQVFRRCNHTTKYTCSINFTMTKYTDSVILAHDKSPSREILRVLLYRICILSRLADCNQIRPFLTSSDWHS